MRERIRPSRRRLALRWVAVAVVLALVGWAAVAAFGSDPKAPTGPAAGTPQWAGVHYGEPDAPGFEEHNIRPIDFLGRTMFVHKKAQRHFLRLESLFLARAPEYAAAVALGVLDDWSYENRSVRGAETAKSNHAFGLAVDVNALANVMGTTGDMPAEVVSQWEAEGGDWGGDWSRPDPMHFETHLTPAEIRARYDAEGNPKDWYLDKLIGG